MISDRFNRQLICSNGPGREGGCAAVLGADSEAALGLSLCHRSIVATYAALTLEQQSSGGSGGGALQNTGVQQSAAPGGRGPAGPYIWLWVSAIIIGLTHSHQLSMV